MPTMYVANMSKQRFDMIYAVPDEARPRRQSIAPGSQIVVYQKDAALPVINSIVNHFRIYGMIDVSEIDRTKPFVGLCYSFDKPVKVEKIMYADEHNSGVLSAASQEARELSARALHNAIEKTTEGAMPLNALELEVIEQNSPDDNGMSQKIVVEKDPNQSSKSRRGRPARVN